MFWSWFIQVEWQGVVEGNRALHWKPFGNLRLSDVSDLFGLGCFPKSFKLVDFCFPWLPVPHCPPTSLLMSLCLLICCPPSAFVFSLYGAYSEECVPKNEASSLQCQLGHALKEWDFPLPLVLLCRGETLTGRWNGGHRDFCSLCTLYTWQAAFFTF